MRYVSMVLTLFAAWLLLTWSADPGELAAGAVAAVGVAAVLRRTAPEGPVPWFRPVRLGWFVLYAAVLAWAIVKANLDVAYRLLHPDLPIRPGIVKVRTTLRSPIAITALANSITLTPGTLTVGAGADGVLYVHCIWLDATDVESATRRIVAPFEGLLRRIWE